MPVRRTTERQTVVGVDALSAFKWSSTGDGCDHLLGKPHFRDRGEAERAWQQVRRQVWARTFRFTVPSAAKIYDGFTAQGIATLRLEWSCEAFDLAAVISALTKDRANAAAFEATSDAKIIRDYLELFHTDLDVIEHAARSIADRTADNRFESYPHHLNTAQTYGHLRP